MPATEVVAVDTFLGDVRVLWERPPEETGRLQLQRCDSLAQKRDTPPESSHGTFKTTWYSENGRNHGSILRFHAIVWGGVLTVGHDATLKFQRLSIRVVILLIVVLMPHAP